MFNISGTEIIVILLLALVVLGPEKLPDAMRRAGRTYAEIKRMSSSFQSEMRSALDEPMKEMRDTADLLRNAATFETGPSTSSSTSAAASREPTAPPAPASASPLDPAVEPTDDELVARTLSGGAAPAPVDGTVDGEAEAGDGDDADGSATA